MVHLFNYLHTLTQSKTHKALSSVYQPTATTTSPKHVSDIVMKTNNNNNKAIIRNEKTKKKLVENWKRCQYQLHKMTKWQYDNEAPGRTSVMLMSRLWCDAAQYSPNRGKILRGPDIDARDFRYRVRWVCLFDDGMGFVNKTRWQMT